MRALFSKTVFVVIISMVMLEVSSSLGNPQLPQSPPASSSTTNQYWEIFDGITPTLDRIEWFEEGVHPGPPSWISDGRWYNAHSRQILVKSGNHIFATFSETFNWTAVNESFEKELWHIYPSFDDFETHVSNDPAWWLLFSWNIPTDWLGIALNRTKVVIEFDAESSTAHIEISCHITNIPGYFMETFGRPAEIGIGGEKLPRPFFAGFDLTAIYIGDFEALQFHDDYGADHGYYRIYFKAPANLLSQRMDTYSLSLRVSPQYIGQIHDPCRFINISMPSDTEVQSASPSNITIYSENTVTFTLNEGGRYPEAFRVTSGPPIKDFTEIFLENVGRWVTEPEIWVALGTAIAAFYAAFHGKRIWGRQKTYYRLYRSMVRIYDHYSSNLAKFHQEIADLSKSITNYFIEGKINDDQFDKLLTRRDDFIERAKKLQQRS